MFVEVGTTDLALFVFRTWILEAVIIGYTKERTLGRLVWVRDSSHVARKNLLCMIARRSTELDSNIELWLSHLYVIVLEGPCTDYNIIVF